MRFLQHILKLLQRNLDFLQCNLVIESLPACSQALTERAIHPGREVPSVPATLLAGMNMPPELAEQEGRGIYY